MVRKTNLIIAAIIAFAMMALTGCPQADLSNVGATVGLESIDAPVITDQTFDGGIILGWAPVKDASAYYIYRAENTKKGYKADQFVTAMPATQNWLVDMPSLNSNSIKDGVKYRYRVVAKSAHQLKSDSEATKTVKAVLKPQGSQVAKAENVKVTFENDEIKFTFDKPDYLNAEVRYTFDVEGLEWDGNTIFGTESADDWGESYYGDCEVKYLPAIGGAVLKYTITTKWGDKYYAENTVEGTATVPAADITVPTITCYDVANEYANYIAISFEDTVGGTYKLYRAVEGEGAYKFAELTDDFTIETQYECQNNDSTISYSYVDTNVENGKSYIYVLTGTVDSKAMVYQDGAKKIVTHNTYSDTYDNVFAPNFSVSHTKNDGTVDISFNVQEGWSYKIERCLIGTGVHDETPVTVGTVEGKINGVKHVKDTITKSAYGLQYKYTLIAEKNGVKKYVSEYEHRVTYAEAYVYTLFDDLYLSREYPLFDGTVDINFSVTPQFTNFKFYRAEVESLYSDKYITEFSDITSSVVYDSSSDWTSYKEYTYKDKTAKADKYYRYDIKATYKGETVDIDSGYEDVSTY